MEMKKEKMGGSHKMDAKVDDYQKPIACYSQAQFGKTLEYMQRQDREQVKAAKDIEKQAYKGRYS